MRVEEWRGEKCDQKMKYKSKTMRASQPEWNKNFTIKTQNPESCLMTLKVKKSSELGLNTI
jgi:Ca2+-dependent lipid-binding protein